MHAHHLIYGLDLVGTAVFAFSGALAAGRKRMDVFGVFVLALVTALGGGTLRDVLLDTGPAFWIHDRAYLAACLVGAIAALITVHLMAVPRRALLMADAIGLAVFTVIGAAKAMEVTSAPSVIVIMGVMTGVVGGMIRDVLSAEVPLILRKEVYATASLCGALVYVQLTRLDVSVYICLVLSTLATLAIRLVALRWGVSLPVFEHDQDA